MKAFLREVMVAFLGMLLAIAVIGAVLGLWTVTIRVQQGNSCARCAGKSYYVCDCGWCASCHLIQLAGGRVVAKCSGTRLPDVHQDLRAENEVEGGR